MGDCRVLERTTYLKPGDQADRPWRSPFVESRGEGLDRTGPPQEGGGVTD